MAFKSTFLELFLGDVDIGGIYIVLTILGTFLAHAYITCMAETTPGPCTLRTGD